MAEQIIVAVTSGIVSAAITIALDEWRYRFRQRGMLVRQIVDKFLELRKEGSHECVYELRVLQCSGVLLLKKEKDADEVLRRIKATDKPIELPEFIRKEGVLKGLRRAIDQGIDIGDFRAVTTEEIRQATS